MQRVAFAVRSLSASAVRTVAVRPVVALQRPVLARAAPVVAVRSLSTVQTFLDEGEVTERVLAVVKGFEKVEPAKVTATAHFANDLGLDSLDAVEVCMAIEEEFAISIPDADAEKILSTQDAIAYISTHPQAK